MTVVEIDGELWIDSGYGLKQIAELVGSIAYLYDGGIIQLTEEEDFERRWEFVKDKASKEALSLIENLSEVYENTYQFTRTMPWNI